MKRAKETTLYPTKLAFERKISCSDAVMYGTSWEGRMGQDAVPLRVKERGIRGVIATLTTKNNNGFDDNADDKEKSNMQVIDACFLPNDKDTLRLSFTMKVLPIGKPHSCNNGVFEDMYHILTNHYCETNGFRELGKRYAVNLANGRFLWRNYLGAKNIEVHVTVGEHKYVFSSYDFSLHDFNTEDEAVLSLGTLIADALSGKSKFLNLSVVAYALVGNGQEVYPSQEYLPSKASSDARKDTKKKFLYESFNVAAMHSQKIGNAIRTVDTWYQEDGAGEPISSELFGVVTNYNRVYRGPSTKLDFFTILENSVKEGHVVPKEQEDYLFSVLVRGCVAGKGKNEKASGKSEE